MAGLFITGSDTGVGKTHISCQLITELRRRGHTVTPRKPVESGCERIDGLLFPSDAYRLLQASQSNNSLDQVCPYRFEPAISPQLAARLVQTPLQLSQLEQACTDHVAPHEFLLVEGAGGILSPLCEGSLNADLARALGLPVILVVSNRLGAVNQALMALNAATQHQLDIKCIILNCVAPESPDPLMDNLSELQQFTDIPVISLSYSQTLSTQQLDSCLD